MGSPVDRIARSAAQRLALDADLPALVPEVERQLEIGDGIPSPDRYEPVTMSIAALLVSVASLAWTVYTDLKKQTPKPDPEVVKRRIRVEIELPDGVPAAERDRIITAVVEQAMAETAKPEQPDRGPTA